MFKKKRNILTVKHAKKITEIQNLEQAITNEVFRDYIDEGARAKLLKDANTYCYSKKQITDIANVFQNYDTNSINYETASRIIEMEKHIQNTKNEGIFSKIGNFINPKDE